MNSCQLLGGIPDELQADIFEAFLNLKTLNFTKHTMLPCSSFVILFDQILNFEDKFEAFMILK